MNEKKNMLSQQENLNFYINFSYIFSNVTIEKLRRHIYLYSPLTFTNKSNKKIFIIINAKNMSNYFLLIEPDETIGIPFEYFDGELKFELNGDISNSLKIYDLLNTNVKNNFNAYTKSFYNKPVEIKFDKEYLCIFVNENFIDDKFNPSGNKEDFDVDVPKTLKNYIISYPYCIRNLMPFDIKVKIISPSLLIEKNTYYKSIKTGNLKLINDNLSKTNINKNHLKEKNKIKSDFNKIKNENLIQLDVCENTDEVGKNIPFIEENNNSFSNLEVGEYIIKKSDQIFITNISPLHDLEAEMSFLRDFKSLEPMKIFDFSKINKFQKEKFLNNHSFKIYDPNKNEIEILSNFSDDNLRTLYLHCAGILINETGINDLDYYYMPSKKGQEIKYFYKRTEKTNIFLIDPNQKLIIEFQEMKSNPINLKVIGIENVIELTNKEGFIFEVVFVSKLSLLSQELNYWVCIYTLYPKFIFYNDLKYDLHVKVVDSEMSKEKEISCLETNCNKINKGRFSISSGKNINLETNNSPNEILRIKEKIPFYFFNKGSKNLVKFLPLHFYNRDDINVISEENVLHENTIENIKNGDNKDNNNKEIRNNSNHPDNLYLYENKPKNEDILSSPNKYFIENKKSPEKLQDNINNNFNLNNSNSLRNNYNKLNHNNIDWDWSFSVDLNNDKIFTFQIFSKDKKKRKLINLEKKIEKYTTFIKLKEVTENTCQIKIENYSKYFGLRLQQHEYDEYSIKVNPLSSELFSWIDLQKKKILDMKIFRKNVNSHMRDSIYFNNTTINSLNKEFNNFINSTNNNNFINKEIIQILSFEILENKLADLTTELNSSFNNRCRSLKLKSFIGENSIRLQSKEDELTFNKYCYSNTYSNVNIPNEKFFEYPYEISMPFVNTEREEEYIMEIKIESNDFRKIIKIKDFTVNNSSEYSATNEIKQENKLGRPEILNKNLINNVKELDDNISVYSPKIEIPCEENSPKIRFKRSNYNNDTRIKIEENIKKEKIVDPKNSIVTEKSFEDSKNTIIKNSTFNLNIPYLGISIIGDNKNINYSKSKYDRTELFYFSIKGIDVIYDLKENKFEEYKIIIEDIKLDNQFSDIAIFPNIIVSGRNFEEALKKNSKYKNKINAGSNLILNGKIDIKNKENENLRTLNRNLFKLIISTEIEKKDNLKHIKIIDYDFSPFYLNIDTLVINKIFEFSDNLTFELETSVTPVDQIFLKDEEEILDKILSRKSKSFQHGKLLLKNENIRSSIYTQKSVNNIKVDSINLMNPILNDTVKNSIKTESAKNVFRKNPIRLYSNSKYSYRNSNNNLLNEGESKKISKNLETNLNNYAKSKKSNKQTNKTEETDNKRLIKEDYIQPFWETTVSIEKGDKEKYLISKLILSKIEINLSFLSQGNAKQVFKRLLSANPFVTSVVSSLTNLENVKLLLKGAELHNVYGDILEIINNIGFSYKQSALSQIIKLLGSFEIIGNPINLMSNLGAGFKDFIEKPVEGLKKNVIEGAKGVAEGSLSLVRHTVKGTFGTTSKITSGFSKGFLYITQDDEYIKNQQLKKIVHKPKNFVEGLGYGLSSMAGGIYNGFKDVIMKPIEGAKEEKWKGFGKGVLKGFAGVIIKPISGVLDLVSQTSEGIKNTLIRELDDNRERWPRMFYGKLKFVNFIIF